MEKWQDIIDQSVTDPLEIEDNHNINGCMRKVTERYPMRLNRYLLDIMEPGDAVWKQVVPDIRELDENPEDLSDPLFEDKDASLPAITHRYKDRLLFLVSLQCSAYCRFCTRKRKVGESINVPDRWIEDALEYISEHEDVRDVIISGGDPLLLSDDRLEYIISEIRKIEHVEIIRVHSRTPSFLPQRITEELAAMLKKYHPLFFNIHFNHPQELTPESKKACMLLADAGIPLGSQTVLLKGINDDPEILKELFTSLLEMRIRPYHLYQADLVCGTGHFRTSIQKGLKIMSSLQGHISGLAVPFYVLDAPGGGGKVILQPKNIVKLSSDELIIKDYRGHEYSYPNPD